MSDKAFTRNFQTFDGPTCQIFLIMIRHLQREINISAGDVLKIKLSIDAFLVVNILQPLLRYLYKIQ